MDIGLSYSQKPVRDEGHAPGFWAQYPRTAHWDHNP
jgi:hypothetical protein